MPTRMNAAVFAAVMLAGASLTYKAAFADPPDAFIKEAIQGNLAEAKMGELAQKNGSSDAVKSFGKMLADDHGKARDQSISIAKAMKVTPPTEPSAEQKANYDMLAKKTGAAFDKDFAHHMVMDHQKDIAKYEEEAKEKESAQVSKYAADTLPTLRKHLQTAQSLDK